ncbi:MAG: acetyl-CoA carboxylase biotin carboxyl carrier protein subunit, partial [Bacteroidota bacterium]
MPHKYLATTGDHEYPITVDSLSELDLIQLTPGHYHLLHNGTSYTCTLDAVDLESKVVQLKINGNPHTVKLADSYDQLVKQLGLSA